MPSSADYRLSTIFGIVDYSTVTPSALLKQLCCLRNHYQIIKCSLFHVNEVERCQLTDVLECALGLIKKFETALMQEESSKPSQYVLTTAKCLFDYLASSHYIALIKQDGTRVTVFADYGDIYSYGVYLTNNCSCRPELRYLIECGTADLISSTASVSSPIFNPPKSIPDGLGSVSEILTLPAVRISSANNLTVWIDLVHINVGDLKVTVTLPSGHVATVFDRLGIPASGGSGRQLNGVYIFNPSFNSVLPESSGTNVISIGNYQPSNADGSPNLNWSSLNIPASILAGNWTLEISDLSSSYSGTLKQWGIIIS